MVISLREATMSEAEIVRNMYSLYLHDLSAFSDSLTETVQGTYEFESFPLLWEKKGINIYFVMANEAKAGFILLLESPFTRDVDYVINDFFIYKRFRKKGVGKETAKLLFKQKPGSYFVAQLERNEPAIQFWHHTYHSLGIRYEEYREFEDNEKIICQEFVITAEKAE